MSVIQYTLVEYQERVPASHRRLHGNSKAFHFRHKLQNGEKAGEDIAIEDGAKVDRCQNRLFTVSSQYVPR